ncbi:hypothetical protein AQJ11_37725 [Streptomyces corchorusii]|uniref:N-acetyltransferase domain-containing protein n=2 Tax=Streptomyces TaxID=1883 RepID=A0A101PTW7_STRCK|nr:hypothetical protein [Streptomyces corchorusii]KUN17605.1 hypothetical protein AQJ11_37725 [Streptomyces corchorusii]
MSAEVLAGPPYEARPLSTRSQQAEASVLDLHRIGSLVLRGLPHNVQAPASYLVPDRLTEPVGLFEDAALIGCLLLHRSPDLRHWGPRAHRPGLLITHAHSIPGTAGVGRLMTLWATDFAARLGVPCVRAEIPDCHQDAPGPGQHLLRHAEDLGWEICGYGAGWCNPGQRVARVEMPAEPRPGLVHLIRCTVPLRQAATAAAAAAGDDSC